MGLFNKIKNMFTEEYEEETKEPIKKEVFQVEIPAPKIEEKKEEVKEEPKKEDKFVFPVYFDDSDLEVKEEPAFVPKPQPTFTQPIKARPQAKPEVKKTFKPSPVISPVYGVLDKNYKKDDIVSKQRVTRADYFSYKGGNDASVVEDIRKKAFGTLEDELENTLSKIEINTDDGQIEQNVSVKVKEELEAEAMKDQDDLEGMFFNSDMTLEEAISKYDEKLEEAKPKKEEKDDLIESDLFNLIDSMYDKDDDKEKE